MASVKSDFLERLISQLGLVLQALLGLRKRPPEEAEEVLADASRSLLGMEYRVLVSVDARSAAALLHDALRIEVFARLVEEEASVLEAQGAMGLAAQRRALALELLEAAAPLGGIHHPEAASRRAHLTQLVGGLPGAPGD